MGLFRKKPKAEGPLQVWMHPIEFSQLRAVVETLAPRHVLEWGAGGSTRQLLAHGPYIERYVSIEHNAHWAAKVRQELVDPRLELHQFDPTVPEPDPQDVSKKRRIKIRNKWFSQCERDRSILQPYVDFPKSLGIEFDFVLVDGRARVHCVEVGLELLRSGGALVIHDAQREDYQPTLKSLDRAVFLEPWQQGQICVVRKP